MFGVSMRALVVFALGVLGFSLAEGRVVTKCELRQRLFQVIATLPQSAQQSGLKADDIVAKIVCHAEQGSNFTTSLITQVAAEKGQHGAVASTEPPHARNRRHSNQGQSSGENDGVWAMYGLFQLSSPQFCSSGENATPNICQTSCSNFIDDDITDDISCVLKILTDLLENGFRSEHWNELKKMIKVMFQEKCRAVQAKEYFAACQ
ncbi:hypothetical protein OJAV_G00010010 [Oryzias javanicus]|uniref:lysozyme n=1 Tax=Oryzias javanicus TaxID=123683 RepID=A0A3S2PIB2_ORYJA|nr:hypothetical protein OJAV_G00010010 [Oryzias javanicus]